MLQVCGDDAIIATKELENKIKNNVNAPQTRQQYNTK